MKFIPIIIMFSLLFIPGIIAQTYPNSDLPNYVNIPIPDDSVSPSAINQSINASLLWNDTGTDLIPKVTGRGVDLGTGDFNANIINASKITINDQNIDDRYVNITGDTMTGSLKVDIATESITLTGDHINYESSAGDNNFHFQGDNIAWIGADFYINNFRFTNNIIFNSGGTISFSNNNIELDADNSNLFFGASQDASIDYNGSDLLINPKVVGTGKVIIQGDLEVDNNITADTYFGDGSQLTGISSLNNLTDQELNTTSNVTFNSINVTKQADIYGGINIKPDGDSVITPIDVSIDFNSNIPSAIMDFDSELKDFLSNARMINLIMEDNVLTDDTLRRYEAIGFTFTPQLFVAGTPTDTREYFGGNWLFNAGGSVVGSPDFTTTGLKMEKKADLNFGGGTFIQRGIDLRGWALGTGISEQYAIYSDGGNWTMKHDSSIGKFFQGASEDVDFGFNSTDWVFESQDITANDNMFFNRFDSYNFDNDAKINGDLNVTGNITGNEIYGDIHFHNDSINGFLNDIVTQNVWINITGFNDSANNHVTNYTNGLSFIAGDNFMTCQVAGRYKGTYFVAFGNTGNNQEYNFVLAVNGDRMLITETHRKVGASGDVGSASGGGSFRCDVGEIINLQAVNVDGNADLRMHVVTMIMERIGQ